MTGNRSPFFLLTGLILGIAAGLIFSLVISPAAYEDVSPIALSGADKDTYRGMIALAYSADGNLGRAIQRLHTLSDEDLRQALAEQAQRLMADPLTRREARALAELSVAIQQAGLDPSYVGTTAEQPTLQANTTQFATLGLSEAVQTATPVLPTETPQPTRTLRPTLTPLPTLNAPFVLSSRVETCAVDKPLIKVWVTDDKGNPLPGMRVEVFWLGGSDYFYTGLYPKVSPGYGDFEMLPGVIYSLRVGESGQVVDDLTTPECKDSNGSPYPGGWELIFSQ